MSERLIVWEFEVAPGQERSFERFYGSKGDWARLFAREEGFLGTELWRDASRSGRYLTFDRWRAEGDFERFRQRWAAEYAALEEPSSRLKRSERLLSTLTLVDGSGEPV
jgi:heme-degrading monooxygenase HmoA